MSAAGKAGDALTTARANWIVGTLVVFGLAFLVGVGLLAIGESLEQAYDAGYTDATAGRLHR